MDKDQRLHFFDALKTRWPIDFSYTNNPGSWQLLDVKNERGHHTHYEWRFEGGRYAHRLGVEFHIEKCSPSYIATSIGKLASAHSAEIESRTGHTLQVEPNWKPSPKLNYGRIFMRHFIDCHWVHVCLVGIESQSTKSIWDIRNGYVCENDSRDSNVCSCC